MDWFGHIRAHTDALADLSEGTDPARPVPTCPGWSMADLTWHLLEVQDFWEHIITNRPAGPETYIERDRLSDAELASGLRAACGALTAALEAADPAEEAWSWTFDHTVGFTPRRQAHEAFVHLADGLDRTGDHAGRPQAIGGTSVSRRRSCQASSVWSQGWGSPEKGSRSPSPSVHNQRR